MTFKLRSGNGPLAFKNMGSSPAKQSLDLEQQTKNYEATKEAQLSSQTPKQEKTTSEPKKKKSKGLSDEEVDTIIEVGNVIGGKGSYTTKREKKSIDLSNQLKEIKMDDYKSLIDKRNELKKDKKNAVGEDGKPIVTSAEEYKNK